MKNRLLFGLCFLLFVQTINAQCQYTFADSASNEAWVNQYGTGGATAALNYEYLTLPLTQGDTLKQLNYSISWKNHGWGNSGVQSNAKIKLFNNNTFITTLATIFEANSSNAAIYHVYTGSLSLDLPISTGYNVKVEINAPNWGGNTWESWINSANITAVTGTQDPMPTVDCWETATFDNATCAWVVTGTQDPMPIVDCWETANFDTPMCSWIVTGTQDPMPTGLVCWETATFDNTTCAWVVTGTQDPIPTVDCWETANFDTLTCAWAVTGTQDPLPTVNCWETSIFDNTTCAWVVTGTQDPMPTALDCWEAVGLFNTTTCAWDINGSQPTEPSVVDCWDNFIFNTGTCVWDNTGTQDSQPPVVNCWDNFVFNTTTCVWDNTESQPIPPILACYETLSLFNTATCAWDIESNEIFLDFTATSPICRYNESTLSINISNSDYNTYTISLQDSILKSFVIDTNGFLIPEGVPITLTPNFSGNVYIVSLTDTDECTVIYNDNVHIQVKQLPLLAINEEDICEGSPSFTLNNATPNGGFYSINNNQTNYFDVENLGAGAYNIRYTYTDPISSCSNQINEIITISESPEAGMLFSPQPTDIDNPNIFFRDNSNEIVIYSEWDLGDGTIINDEMNFWHTYADTGTYTIKYYITNMYECTDSVIKDLTINPKYQIFIPSAFSPNNDGDNDYFYPLIIGGNSYNMKIYNRWGEIVYNKDDGAWDGKSNNNALQYGLYSYSILVNDFKNKPFIYTGIITILK